MKNNDQNIRHYELPSSARSGATAANMEERHAESHDISKPHRDNHCQLMLASGGKFKLSIDFEIIEFAGPALVFVFPEQVHHLTAAENPRGWTVSFDPSLADKEILLLLEDRVDNPIVLPGDAGFPMELLMLAGLIGKLQSENQNSYILKAIHSLLNGILSLVAGEIAARAPLDKEKENRGVSIRSAFLKLKKEHFKTWKQPSQYASALSISASHLNDTVKSLTGSPVSVHIQEASIMEAKRLLYFTDQTVKEIAYQVGYDEPVYFGKLFKKVTDLTPLEFRKKFRDGDYPSSH